MNRNCYLDVKWNDWEERLDDSGVKEMIYYKW